MENLSAPKTREAFVAALAALLAEYDLNTIGCSVKDHEARDKESGEKTGEVTGIYATGQFRMPGITEVTIDGVKLFSKNATFKFDAFKLATEQAATAKPAAKAATISGSALKARLATLEGKATSTQQ